MKATHLLNLDAIFNRTKSSSIGNLDGSITPRTTTEKAILDPVKIGQEAIELYQEQKYTKSCEVLKKLGQDLQSKRKEFNYLEILNKMGNKHIKSNMLDEVREDINIIETRQELMSRSQSILDNCDITDFGFETIYQEGIGENSSSELKEDTPAVLRYGLNTKRLTSLVKSPFKEGSLYPCETELFRLAINYLGQTESAKTYTQSSKELYANNAVLVDIFDRSTGFVNAGNNQTHTLLFYNSR